MTRCGRALQLRVTQRSAALCAVFVHVSVLSIQQIRTYARIHLRPTLPMQAAFDSPVLQAALYRNPAMASMLPAVLYSTDNKDGRVTSFRRCAPAATQSKGMFCSGPEHAAALLLLSAICSWPTAHQG